MSDVTKFATTYSIFMFVLVLSPPGGVCEGFMSREFRDENGDLQKSGSHNQSVQELAKYSCTLYNHVWVLLYLSMLQNLSGAL